jgi:hypothetical protein
MWLGIVQCDILMSFQVGLPTMIPDGKCDTSFPRNLREEDFDEDSTELPPSRPMTEATNTSYYIAKAPLIEVFGRIASHTQNINPSADVAILDAELHAAREGVPQYYKVRSMEESITEPEHMIMRRFAVDQLFQTGLCVLHRKQLVLARSNPQFGYSRRVCIDAAMTLLEYQAIKHHETMPAGRLPTVKWMVSSITRNDYLLAAMLLCLDLQTAVKEQPTSQISNDVSLWGRDRQDEMLQALEISYHIWKESSEGSKEAFRASQALAVMLGKVRPGRDLARQRPPSAHATNDTPEISGKSMLIWSVSSPWS